MGTYQQGLVVLLPFLCGSACLVFGSNLPGLASEPELAIVAVPLAVAAYWILRTWGRRRYG